MSFKNILFTNQKNGITTIALNRPSVFNALNEELCLELIEAFSQCGEEETKVVILTGSGKGFCAGQDLANLPQDLKIIPSELIERCYNPLIMSMRQLAKPIICRLNGIAAGAGCSLALACDLIIASEEASLVEAFVNIGLAPDSGSSYFLPRIVGRLKAFELLSLGSKITAEKAEQLGMVNKVVPAALLNQTVDAIALSYIQIPLKAVGLIKQLLNNSYNLSLEQALDQEAKIQDIAAKTEDFKEGILAFKEKRTPKFKGI